MYKNRIKQAGFTIMELLLVAAIGGLISGGVIYSIQRVYDSTSNNRSRVIVLDNMNTAAIYLKRDIQAYQTVELNSLSAGGNATFAWTDHTEFLPESERDHSSIYHLSDNGTLYRSFDGVNSLIARNIDDVIFTLDGNYINVLLTATSNTYPYYSGNLSFSVYKRTQEEGTQ